jgi:UDP-N-acetylglucosamine 2-epimerase
LGRRNILATFHSETLADDYGLGQLEALLAALDAAYGPGDAVWFTKANADSGGAAINARIADWVADRSWTRLYPSLGHSSYLSLMNYADLIIGNSSSGLYEAPAVGTPTVNVGGRQGGRLTANSVFDAAPDVDAIGAAIRAALDFDPASAVSPYGDGFASSRIIGHIRNAPPRNSLLVKRFFPL